MKKVMMLLFLVTVTTGSNGCVKESDSSHSFIASVCNPTSNLSLKYIRSMLTGALVGAGTGIVSAYCDTIIPSFWPITWFAAMNARCDLVTSIGNDMNVHEVNYHDGLMRLSALVVSWVSWYKTYCHLNGYSPFVKS